MKKVFFLFILYPILCLSQIKSGILEYGLVIDSDPELESGMLGEYYKSAVENAKHITFTLNFNDTAMLFFVNPKMNGDATNTSFAIAFSGANGIYYKEKNSNIVYNELNNSNFEGLIITSEVNQKWVLSNENKLINNYLCYKATSTLTINNGVRTFKNPIIAWYCPEIPVPYGPMGYGNLPGLILEFQNKNVVFGLSKITLNPEKLPKIEKPTKGKIVTEAEFSEIAKKSVEQN